MGRKGHIVLAETAKKIVAVRRANNSYKHKEETKKKMRLVAIKRIERHYGICHPNFNLEACEFFKSFDKEHQTQGQYATNGGEYFIKELGYFVDYFNRKMRLIQEWDEKKHYDMNGNLKEKDVKRQKEIMRLYPDFEFRRIKNGQG